MKMYNILFSLIFLMGFQCWGQSVFRADKTIAIEKAKLLSLGICSHETNRGIVGGDAKKLSFFKFQVLEKSDEIQIHGFCNSIQNHPSMSREKTEFQFIMKTVFPLNKSEGYDYGRIGSHKIRVRWSLENTNPIDDPDWQKFVHVRYHNLEFYFDLPLLGLWSPLNSLKIDLQNISTGDLHGVALRNLRGLSVEKASAGFYHLNYTNLEEYYRNTHSNKLQAQGIGISVNDQVYGCIYSSYASDGSIEAALDSKKCYELYLKAKF